MTVSFSRERGEKGFALVTALLLAMIYLGLIMVVLSESTLAIRAAERFRARTVAEIYADNALELAWAGDAAAAAGDPELEHGSVEGEMQWEPGDRFSIVGTGVWEGVRPLRKRAMIRGRIDGKRVRIEYVRD